MLASPSPSWFLAQDPGAYADLLVLGMASHSSDAGVSLGEFCTWKGSNLLMGVAVSGHSLNSQELWSEHRKGHSYMLSASHLARESREFMSVAPCWAVSPRTWLLVRHPFMR